MHSLDTGEDLLYVRQALKITQKEFSERLDVSLATYKRYEASQRLDTLVALAVECLLRRKAIQAQTNRRVTPEERAERKFAEQEHLRKLRQAAGLTGTGGRRPMTPEEFLDRRDTINRLKIERARLRMEAKNEQGS